MALEEQPVGQMIGPVMASARNAVMPIVFQTIRNIEGGRTTPGTGW
jgi:hypothetical protein